MRFSPPKPTTVELVVRPENNGHQLPICPLYRVSPLANTPQNFFVLCVSLATRNNVTNRRFGNRINPVKTSRRHWIRKMPGGGNNASPVISIDYSFSYPFFSGLNSFL